MVEANEAIEHREGEVVIRGDDLEELEGYLRYSTGRGLYLIPTRVHVGNTTPRDITDEDGDENRWLKLELSADGQTTRARIQSRTRQGGGTEVGESP